MERRRKGESGKGKRGIERDRGGKGEGEERGKKGKSIGDAPKYFASTTPLRLNLIDSRFDLQSCTKSSTTQIKWLFKGHARSFISGPVNSRYGTAGWARRKESLFIVAITLYCQPTFMAQTYHTKLTTEGYRPIVSPSNTVRVTTLPCKILIMT